MGRNCTSMRGFSGASGLMQTSKEDGVATVKMSSPPVNIMNVDFFEALRDEIREVEQDKSIHSMVLASSQKVFSAGLDLQSMYQKTDEELAHFWSTFRDMYITLYSTRLCTVAAIQGASPAGGCIMSNACDARIMSVNGHIGLNEAAFGLVVPKWAIDAMVDVVGMRHAEKACSQGIIYSAQEALDIGLIDTLLASPDDVLAEAYAEARRWNVPGRAATKALIRGPKIAKFHANAETDINSFVGLVGSKRIQAALGAYLESLKQRQK